jgi:hypothetical protein
MTVDRRAVVARHRVELTEADPATPLTVGNGDFAFTADITGMQSFTDFHTPRVARLPGPDLLDAPVVVNTCTMSTWGWHEMPNPAGWTLADAMTEYESPRGTVQYPDRFDMAVLMGLPPDPDKEAGTWLHRNPQRLDLGRLGLELRSAPDAAPETDPAAVTSCRQRLDLWTGWLTSEFTYHDAPVSVETVAHPSEAIVAFRIRSPLLATGQLTVRAAFAYASESFFNPNDWDADDRHTTQLTEGNRSAILHRTVDATGYDVGLAWSRGKLATGASPHTVRLTTDDTVLELVACFARQLRAVPAVTFDDVKAASAQGWESYWTTGAALDLSGSSDPRAAELERRVVLSQYLTRVNCSGLMPPQETGLVTNSWQGKAHLEMHWWHAAHFPAWGRPELLERSLAWYESIQPAARGTAHGERYDGVRWPKQVGPDGRAALA